MATKYLYAVDLGDLVVKVKARSTSEAKTLAAREMLEVHRWSRTLFDRNLMGVRCLGEA